MKRKRNQEEDLTKQQKRFIAEIANQFADKFAGVLADKFAEFADNLSSKLVPKNEDAPDHQDPSKFFTTPMLANHNSASQILSETLRKEFFDYSTQSKTRSAKLYVLLREANNNVKHAAVSEDDLAVEKLDATLRKNCVIADFSQCCELLSLSVPHQTKAAEKHMVDMKNALDELTTKPEGDVQSTLQFMVNNDLWRAVDTSESPQDLLNFTLPRGNAMTNTGKPDISCFVAPLWLEIKSRVSKEKEPKGLVIKTALIPKAAKLADVEYLMLQQIFERIYCASRHNGLLKTAVSFGSSGHFTYAMFFKREFIDSDSTEDDSKPLMESYTLVRLQSGEDVARLWLLLLRQDVNYFVKQSLYRPVCALLSSVGVPPGGCVLRVHNIRPRSVLIGVSVGRLPEEGGKVLTCRDTVDLMVKIIIGKNSGEDNELGEVATITHINECCQRHVHKNPVRYVLSTLSQGKHVELLWNANEVKSLLNAVTYKQSDLETELTMKKKWKSWWTPSTARRDAADAVLMLCGEELSNEHAEHFKTIVKKLTDELDLLHSHGVLHTDIRPGNWLFFRNLRQHEDELQPLLIDFDYAVRTDTDEVKVKTMCGARRDVMLNVQREEEDSSRAMRLVDWSKTWDRELLSRQVNTQIDRQIVNDQQRSKSVLLKSFKTPARSKANQSIS